MPYSITTQDGITIDNIPDDVPANAPSLKERVAKIRGQGPAVPPEPGSAKAPTNGYLMGLRDPIDGLAQLARRMVPEGIGQAVDEFGNKLADMGLPVARSKGVEGVDKIVNEVNSDYEQGRQQRAQTPGSLVTQAPEEPGFDWSRLAGNIVNPVNLVAAPGAAAARTLPQIARVGATAGAIGGAMQPVVGDTENFGMRKAVQAIAGAATGAVATPALSAATRGIGRVVNNVSTSRAARRVTPEQVNVAAANAARSQGYNWAEIPEAMQQAIRAQADESLRTGQRLDPVAAIRRAEAEAVGLTGDRGLTTGQATRDPMLFTQERNLRGVEISTPEGRGNPLMTRFANQNQALLENFDQLGAAQATDAGTAGQTLADALRAADAPVRAGVDEAYNTARAMNNGRAAPLERGIFSQNTNAALDQGQWGRFLPPEVRGLLNDISSGNAPFDVDAAVQIDSILSAAQRQAGQGSPQASAVGVVRNALRETPLSATDFPDGGSGQAARDAFDAARQAARNRFATIESTPAMAAALDDVAPDRFVQQFILNGNARDLQQLRTALEGNPQALGQARAQVAAHLRRAAFGENMTADKPFAPERFAQTLRAIGPQRLSAFFSPEEIVQLNLVARAGANTNTQMAGSAVNNSNTGSALMSMLGRLAQGTPVIRAVANQVGEIRAGRQINQALSGQAPVQPPQLSPETMRALQSLFPLTGTAAGSAGGMAGR